MVDVCLAFPANLGKKEGVLFSNFSPHAGEE